MIGLYCYGKILAVLLMLCGFISLEPVEDEYDIPKIFNEELIVPDVIPVPPKLRARMFYPRGEILPGSAMSYNESSFPPVNVSWPYEEGALYTLFMSGISDWKLAKDRTPDYKQGIHGQEWHQWLVSNIPQNNISAGVVNCELLLAGDPCIEGMRDLIMLLIYKQRWPVNITVDNEPGWIEFQRDFRPYRFARRYRLGHPIAGSYHYIVYEGYKGEYDDYDVPQ
ncbi:protein D2-like [Planococcus citri]|uniref:protein D2-like n=1 Tax=Planococcus citri TaxID=170843 RepID=UPI0031F76EFF